MRDTLWFLRFFFSFWIVFILCACNSTRLMDDVKSIQFQSNTKEQNFTVEARHNKFWLDNELAYDVDSLQLIGLSPRGSIYEQQKNQWFTTKTNRNSISLKSSNVNPKLFKVQYNKDSLGKHLFAKENQMNCKNAGRFPFSKFIVNNNQWGYYKIKKGKLEQCMYLHKHNKDALVGWKFKTPKKAFGVLSYPAMVFHVAYKPLGEINRFKSKFDYKIINLGGRMNLAFDLWIHEKLPNGKTQVHTEIMIWEKSYGSKPGGRYVKDVQTSNGRTYQLYLGKVNNKRIQKSWQYIAFVNKEARTKGITDVDELIAIAVKNNLLSSGHLLKSLELGTEIVNANGYTIVQEFSVLLD